MGGGGSVRWLQATKKIRVPKTKILKVINGLRFIVYSVSIGEYVLSKQVRAALIGMCGEFGWTNKDEHSNHVCVTKRY
tara:strand:+ start:469 stop:702 length:234 start_codon:yes stop_codon:yes gene_type:complete